MAITDDRGRYEAALPPGTYRVGAFRSYNAPSRDFGDGYTWVTWYGDSFVIGLGKDLVVGGASTVADIAMLRSVKIAGRVVGRDGVGVPDAQLSVTRVVGGTLFPFGSGGVTDPAGRFSFTHVAMPLKLSVTANGRSGGVAVVMDIDLRGDRTDLVITLDRGNIVSGTMRDAAGRPLPNMNFGVEVADPQICGWCNGSTDDAGRFALTLPTTTLRFRNWPSRPGDPELRSKEYVVAGDMTLDPVLEPR